MSLTVSRRAGRTAGGIAASALALSVLNLSPLAVDAAHADSQSASDGATATVADVVSNEGAIHIEGTGWTTSPGSGNGSTIGVKLGDALATEPKAGAVTNPATGTSADGYDVWDAIEADDDGTFSADIAFPTPDNTAPALASAWAVGSTHTLRLLTGSMESGDALRSVLLTFTVGSGLVTSATTATSGDVTVRFSGGAFPVGEVLSVAQGGTARQWTVTSGRTSTTSSTYTVPASGALTATVVIPAGQAPAGHVTLDVTGDHGTSQAVTVVVPPAASFDPGAVLGTRGTLTLSGFAAGATISSVTLGGTTLGTDLTADGEGRLALAYAIAADAPGALDLVVVQGAPDAVTSTISVPVYPNEVPSGTGRFTLTSTTADQNLYQGFYQSAYSAKEDALYVTASDRGTGNAGYLYKLDADTLQVEASHAFVDHDGFTKTGGFGVGVDDVHGNVWVSNTGSSSVAIYAESDLALVKQFPAGTTSHSRDVVFDPSTDLVFVSSASESSSATANGYISAFEADDKDGDGTKYEKVTDIQTGTRDFFNPVALSLDHGTLVSPSLQGNRVVRITTADVAEGYTPTFITVDGLNGVNGVRGSGGSGIAYDAASNRVYVASQTGNEVVVADATTGETLKEVPTGRGALNVAIDHVHGLVYVTNLTGSSVTVLDLDGTKVAALPIASANHVSVDGLGDAFVVDKAASNKVWKITPRLETVDGVDLLNPTAGGVTGDPATTPLKVTVRYGETIHLQGTNFLHPDGASGSTLAVKLDGGAAEPKAGKATNPSNGNASVSGVYAVAAADPDGTWSLDLPFPSAAGVNNPALAWGVGESHYLRLLSGSLKSGDAVRSVAVKVSVTSAGSPAGTVSIQGTAKVGQALRVGTAGWVAGTTLAYQWQRNGAAIADATGTSYVLTAADLGKKVTVKVTGALTGYTTTSVTSGATATIAAGTLVAATPKISGTAQVGKKLTAAAGTWTKGTALTYQWNRSGKAISGAKKSTYTLTASDKGKKITVTVTGKLSGYTTAAKTSASTATVKVGTLTKATPKISGTAKVGKTLKVKAGTWTAGTKLTYRWYANGKAISGRTSSSLKLSSSLTGKKITVKVTGKKSGYTTVTTTSKATAKVKR